MKKIILIFLTLALMCSCSAPKTADSSTDTETTSQEETSENSPNAETPSQEENADLKESDNLAMISFDTLNNIAAELIPNFDEPISFEKRNELTYYQNECFELFCSSGIGGYKTILTHSFEDDSWHWVDLGEYACQNITNISSDYDNPKILIIVVDGTNFGYDHYLNDFSRRLRFNEYFSGFEVVSYGGSENIWDAELLDIASHENIAITEIEFKDKSAKFSFDLAGEPVGNGYPYPHISIRKGIDTTKKQEKLYYVYEIYFHNIYTDFSQEQIDTLKEILNAEAVSVTKFEPRGNDNVFIDSLIFEGSLLTIDCWYEPGIKFNIELPKSYKDPDEVFFTIYTD